MDMTKGVVGHVTLNLYFYIRWDMWVTVCIPAHPWRETSTHYFSCSGGTGMDLIKAHRDMLHQTCVFASGGIYGSRSTFRCIWVVKCRCTIFILRWDWYDYDK
jgi:hypothetical protein